jgi:serine/threonine protein kinase
MENNQKVKSLLDRFHPKYKIIKYDGHHIMKSEKFGESLNYKEEQLKLSSQYTIHGIMKQFLSEGFYHGDLYTQPKFNYSNVLISDDKIKLIDFGLVEIERNDTKTYQTLFEEAEKKQLQKEIERSSGENVAVPPPTPAYKKRKYPPNDFEAESSTNKLKVDSMQGFDSPPREDSDPVVRRFTFDSPPRVPRVPIVPIVRRLWESPSRGEGYLRAKVYKLY